MHCYRFCLPGRGPFIPVFRVDPLSAWMGSICEALNWPLQVLPQIFHGVYFYSVLWLDHSRTILKPLQDCLGCMLQVIVMLKGEPSPEASPFSVRLCELRSRAFFKDSSVFGGIHPLLNSEQYTCTAATEEQPRKHNADSTIFHHRNGISLDHLPGQAPPWSAQSG